MDVFVKVIVASLSSANPNTKEMDRMTESISLVLTQHYCSVFSVSMDRLHKN